MLLVVAAEEVDHARERHRAVGLEVAAALELLVAAGRVERGGQPLELERAAGPLCLAGRHLASLAQGVDNRLVASCGQTVPGFGSC